MQTLYIGGLDPNADEDRLQELFSGYGEIQSTRLVTDDDGRCRGFAYVTFANDLDAAKARVALDGKQLGERTLRVAVAT